MDDVGARLATDLSGWYGLPVRQVFLAGPVSCPRPDAVRAVTYEGPQREDMRASSCTELTGSYVVPREIYCSRRTVPTSAAARYVVTTHSKLLCATEFFVAPILSEPVRTGLMSPVRRCRGLAEPNSYY